MQPWMDAHCHLTRRFHPAPLEPVLSDLYEDGCRGYVVGGVDPEDWVDQLALPDQPIPVIRGFGLHPWTVQERSQKQLEADFHTLQTMLPKADALGECGLDYFRCKSEDERATQTLWFEKQLELALQQQKPLILHVVRAHHEALRLMKSYAGKVQGVVHSFWANPQTAQSWLDLGFQLSLHPRIHKGDTHGLLSYIPKDRILFESDETDLRLTVAIMEIAAKAQGIPLDVVKEQQLSNLIQLFPRLAP